MKTVNVVARSVLGLGMMATVVALVALGVSPSDPMMIGLAAAAGGTVAQGFLNGVGKKKAE